MPILLVSRSIVVGQKVTDVAKEANQTFLN